jgi:hypothetical protein
VKIRQPEDPMKPSRILVAWLLSMAIFGAFFYVSFFVAAAQTLIYESWFLHNDLSPIDAFRVLELWETGVICLVLHGPALTLSFIVFSHVVSQGFVVSLRGVLVAVTISSICLAFVVQHKLPIDYSSQAARDVAWLYCAFSAFVTVGGLAWLCWQARRAQTAWK